MAFSTKTWNVGDVLTASDMNQYVRDAMLYLFTAIGARVNFTAGTSITNNTPTVFVFNNTRWANGVTLTSTTKLPATVAGKYAIGAGIEWAGNASGSRYVQLRLNGTTTIAMTEDDPSAASPLNQEVNTIYDLAVSDYIECIVYQNSGGALNVTAVSNYSPEFWMVRLGA